MRKKFRATRKKFAPLSTSFVCFTGVVLVTFFNYVTLEVWLGPTVVSSSGIPRLTEGEECEEIAFYDGPRQLRFGAYERLGS